MYSFFNNWEQECLPSEACQENMLVIEQSEGVYIYGLNTKASQYLGTVDNVGLSQAKDNFAFFTQANALFEYP
jgi:glucan 1,3-beta-glucosidase